MTSMAADGMWDEEDGFFYDVLRLPDGSASGSRCARWWACCPLCGGTSFDGELLAKTPGIPDSAQMVPGISPGTARVHS